MCLLGEVKYANIVNLGGSIFRGKFERSHSKLFNIIKFHPTSLINPRHGRAAISLTRGMQVVLWI
jgi:hypothetical protein